MYTDLGRCYICSSCIDNWRIHRIPVGAYSYKNDREVFWHAALWRHYIRMILYDPHDKTCQVSGVAFLCSRDQRLGEAVAVPKDEDVVITGSIGRLASKFKRGGPVEIVDAYVPTKTDGMPKDNISGLVVHANCWDLLRAHRLWDLTGAHGLNTLRDALWSNCVSYSAIAQTTPFWARGPYCWKVKFDPFFSKSVEDLISEAFRQTQKSWVMQAKTPLSQLPLELLLLIADSLNIWEVSALQQVIGRHFGDQYWKSRTDCRLFHEVRALEGQELDWEHLCLGLDNFRKQHPGAIQERESIVGELDKLADGLIKSQGN